MKYKTCKTLLLLMLALCLLVTGTAPAFAAASPPGIPGNTKAQYIAATSIKITWSQSADATGYVIYRCLQPAGSYQRVKVTSALSATDTTVAAGTVYYYKARAYTETTGGNVYGTPSSAFTAVPGIPGNTNAQYTSLTSVKITWSKAAGARGYIVYKSLQPGSGYQRLKVTSALSATDSSVTAGTLYYYKVRAYISTALGNIYGTPSAAFTAPGIPGSPVAKAGVGGSISLSWKAVSGATGYVVYRYLRDSDTAVRYATVKSTAFTDSKITANTFYRYKVRAYSTVSGKNIYGAPSGFFFTPEIPITGLTSPATGMKITRAWRASSGTTGTEVTVVKQVAKTSINATYLTSTGKKYTIYPTCYVAVITAKPQYFGNTCAEITDGKDESYVYSMAKKVGALIAVNGEAYSGHWSDAYSRYYSAGAVIRDRRIIQFIPSITGYGNKFTIVRSNGVWEKDVVIDSKAKAQQLIDSGVRFGVCKGGASLMYFDGKKLYTKDYSKQTLILSNDWMPALRNRTFVAQIDANRYLMLVGELMPVQQCINVLNAYGAKNILWANGGNCAYMYLRGCGNVTGSAGNSIRGIDKINPLESEWKALHGYLGRGQLGGPCPAKDIFYFN